MPMLPPHSAPPAHGPAATALAVRVAAGLPTALVALWAARGGGTLIVGAEPLARYEAGPLLWRHLATHGALWLPADCAAAPLWEAVGGWLDHWGGSFGRGAGRLSSGVGATPTLQAAATRLADLWALGYGADWLGTGASRVGLARAIAAYQQQRQPLSAADPLLARWLRGTLFDEGFWRRVARESSAPP